MDSAETSAAVDSEDASQHDAAPLSLADGFRYLRRPWEEELPPGWSVHSDAGSAFVRASRAIYASRGLVEILQADATCRESAAEGGAAYEALTSRMADQLYVAISTLQLNAETALDSLASALNGEGRANG